VLVKDLYDRVIFTSYSLVGRKATGKRIETGLFDGIIFGFSMVGVLSQALTVCTLAFI
jgi:hypothetical protein